jgi:hypothetical protein
MSDLEFQDWYNPKVEIIEKEDWNLFDKD